MLNALGNKKLGENTNLTLKELQSNLGGQAYAQITEVCTFIHPSFAWRVDVPGPSKYIALLTD